MLTQEITYTDILKDSDKHALVSFKYSGSDKSIWYDKVASPLAQYLVTYHTPDTIAY